MGVSLEFETKRVLLRKREPNPRVKTCYHQHGPVFHIHGETVNITQVEDKMRAEIVERIAKRYEQRSDGI